MTSHFGDFPLVGRDLVVDGVAVRLRSAPRPARQDPGRRGRRGRRRAARGLRGREPARPTAKASSASALGRGRRSAARLTVGADGKHSCVARAVKAPAYEVVPTLACWYFTYFRDVPEPQFEMHVWPAPGHLRAPDQRRPAGRLRRLADRRVRVAARRPRGGLHGCARPGAGTGRARARRPACRALLRDGATCRTSSAAVRARLGARRRRRVPQGPVPGAGGLRRAARRRAAGRGGRRRPLGRTAARSLRWPGTGDAATTRPCPTTTTTFAWRARADRRPTCCGCARPCATGPTTRGSSTWPATG